MSIMTKEKYISLAIIIIGSIVYFLSKKVIKKIIIKNENNSKLDKKKKTYLKLFNNVLKYLLLIIVIILILQVNGVNVSSIVASLGLITVIVGFALQDALKDIIMGINIVVNDYFSIGDVLKIDNIEGKVIEIRLKSTRMKDVNNGNIFMISNRNISQALNLSEQLDIDIPLPYEEKITRVEEVMNTMIEQISKLENVTKVEYKGLNEFGDSAIYYKIRIFCKPEFKPQIKRDSNRIIKLELDKNNINIPYKQIDIHNK
ncbi:MAG: mechanosensitive ion channel family protein [Clostridia bacterium]|nr:mechanosensitive ion channel family protein [Clostridia bacterium]